jgi:hypothetical protein
MKKSQMKETQLLRITREQWDMISRVRQIGFPFLASRVVSKNTQMCRRSKRLSLHFKVPRGFYSEGPSKLASREAIRNLFDNSGLQDVSTEDVDCHMIEALTTHSDHIRSPMSNEEAINDVLLFVKGCRRPRISCFEISCFEPETCRRGAGL